MPILILAVLCVLGIYLLTGLVGEAGLPSFSAQSKSALDFVWFCVADGALTMVLVQLHRSLTPVRGTFHQASLKEWFGATAKTASEHNPPSPDWIDAERRLKVSPGKLSAARAAEQFESFFAAAPAITLYDLPLEQFCAQLGAATESSLEKPEDWADFVLCMAGVEGAALLVASLPKEPLPPPPSVLPLTGSPPPFEDSLNAAQARGGLIRAIQRRIDGFQIGTGSAWRHKLRTRVVATGIILGVLIAAPAARNGSASSVALYVLYGMLGGAMGGFIAMVIRDLTAIVELKRRQP